VKGRITSASFATITPAIGSITGLTANQVAGVISGTTPVGLSVPSCSTSASALLWTSATGFSCNTAVAAPAGSLTGSTLAAGVTASSLTSLGTITTLTATTINAFTLAGTIAGGGNQLNNIIIGTATPLAITGTTITGNTSISSPIHTASGTYTFQSNGSTFAGQITTGQQWEFGANAAPASGPLLTLNQNTATPTASFVGTPSLHMISGDSVIGGIAMDTFANQSFFAPRRANNTQASKTAVAAAATIFSFGAQAYDGTVYSSVASLDFNTVNLQSGSDHSGYMAVRLVAGGSTNLIEKFRLNGSGGLGVGSAVIATDPGNGSIIFSGALQSAGTVPIGNTGTCTATSFSGGATSGKFTAPTCAAGTIILSSMPTVQNGYTCSASDETTTTNTLLQTAQTTSSATFKSTTTNADVVTFSCHGW
jgi:hypothetical protein